jgi:hypothetical protein
VASFRRCNSFLGITRLAKPLQISWVVVRFIVVDVVRDQEAFGATKDTPARACWNAGSRSISVLPIGDLIGRLAPITPADGRD